MQFIFRNIVICCALLFFSQNVFSQCTVLVDTANIQHIACPNGGAVGSAQIIQASYINYSWQNITNGQLYNGGGGTGGTVRNDLDAGWYVVTASNPYSNSCPFNSYSDTFEIIEATIDFQFTPTQACSDTCNVEVTNSMQIAITGIYYSSSFDNYPISPLPYTLDNQCGGQHTYEIFADGVSCGVENIGISQFAQMNLATIVTNVICTQLGSATVNITGVGASAINTYCASSPQNNSYSTIENVQLIGDNFSINNNTSGLCDTYQDYTSQSADVTPGSSYSVNVDLGSCHPQGVNLIDLANIYVDWNIDGDFNDASELIGQISPIQSPSSNVLNFTVPSGAIPGQSRMRIVMQNSQYQPSNQANPCDNNIAWFGATEDYTIVVSGSVANPISYLWSDGQTTQTANNLNIGTYYITITDANGCSATDTAIIIGSGIATVNASGNQTVCNGGIPNSLSANGSSSGTYSWSPPSAFTNPNLQNPAFNSGVNNITTYIVTFIDANGCVATDSVTIIVNPIPTVTLNALPSPACVGDNIQLTANTSLPVNSYRFQYDDGSGWIDMTGPVFTSTNPMTSSPFSSTTQFRVKVREDMGCNPSVWSPIITVPISTVATQPINHY